MSESTYLTAIKTASARGWLQLESVLNGQTFSGIVWFPWSSDRGMTRCIVVTTPREVRDDIPVRFSTRMSSLSLRISAREGLAAQPLGGIEVRQLLLAGLCCGPRYTSGLILRTRTHSPNLFALSTESEVAVPCEHQAQHVNRLFPSSFIARPHRGCYDADHNNGQEDEETCRHK
ncbi:hypothetical protein [Kibdelosporangium philippinense]|uniref:hypothetical protein n=1 Tax=Kibdelosporangium philippinense TaxID=211113 RepID=UPI00360B5F21